MLPPAPEVVVPAYRVVAPAGDDMEAGVGGRGSARPDRAVPPTLEPSRAVPSALSPATGAGGW
jgi:hypothetical protein